MDIRIQRQAEKYKDFLAIRATIDFEAGSIKRAQGVSALEFEWLHRLLSEPSCGKDTDRRLAFFLILKQNLIYKLPW